MKTYSLILAFLFAFQFCSADVRSFTGALGIRGALNERIFEQSRFKRSASDLLAAICLKQCSNTIQTQIDKQTSLDMNTMTNGLLNRQLYQGDNLEKFCSIFNAGRKCMDNCGAFSARTLLNRMLKPIDYLCTVKYNEFQKYRSCLNSASAEVQQTCDGPCGGDTFASDTMRQMKEVHEIDETVQLMDDMCGHVQCSIDCEVPIYTDACQSQKPGALLTDFTRIAIKQSHRILKDASVDYLFPNKCRQLSNGLSRNHQKRTKTNHSHDTSVYLF